MNNYSLSQIDELFKYHPPTTIQLNLYEELRSCIGKNLALALQLENIIDIYKNISILENFIYLNIPKCTQRTWALEGLNDIFNEIEKNEYINFDWCIDKLSMHVIMPINAAIAIYVN
jgi:hypothetical protein